MDLGNPIAIGSSSQKFTKKLFLHNLFINKKLIIKLVC
jgi:hypothetical protein